MTVYAKLTLTCDVPNCKAKLQVATGDYINVVDIQQQRQILQRKLDPHRWKLVALAGEWACVCSKHER